MVVCGGETTSAGKSYQSDGVLTPYRDTASTTSPTRPFRNNYNAMLGRLALWIYRTSDPLTPHNAFTEVSVLYPA